MKTSIAVLAALIAVPVWADIGTYPAPMVREAHNRMPHDRQDNECNENHNLKPDGDADCDDLPSGAPGVPEPATLGLLLAGLGGVLLMRRRR